MTLLDLVEEMRDELDDYGGGDGADRVWVTDDEHAQWKNVRLTALLAQAEDEFCRHVPIFDSNTSACCTITLATGTQDYSLHASVRQVDRVLLVGGQDGDSNDEPLTKVYHEDHDYDVSGLQTSNPYYGNVPCRFYEEDLNHRSIRIHPVPTSDYNGRTLRLTVHRLPLTRLAWLPSTAASTSPSINYLYHPALVHWALYKAFLKKDADAYSPQLSQERYQLWLAEIAKAKDERFDEQVSNRRPRARAQFL